MVASTIPFPRTLTRRDLQRKRDYALNLAWYEGKQWTSPPRRGERQLTLNYAATVIERTAALLLKDTKVLFDPADGISSDQAAAAETAWAGVIKYNQLENLDLETEIDTAVMGDGCYKVTWNAQAGQVVITSPDVQGLHVWWQPDNPAQLLQVATQYKLDEDGAGLLYQFATTKPVTVTERWTPQQLEIWIDDQVVRNEPNPYPWIPFVVFPNLRRPKQYWGLSDIPRIKDVAEELNRALSTLSLIMELSGNPIAVMEGVEASEDIAVRPGAVWNLPTESRAYILDLLSRGGVRLHLDYLDKLYRVMHDLAETPRSAFGDVGRSLSGVALELDIGPLIQRVQRKRLSRTVAYRQRAAMALQLLAANGIVAQAAYSPRIQWGPVTPQDRTRLVQEEQTLVASGIHSRRRAADLTGVEDTEAEYQQWLSEERERAAIRTQERSAPGA